MRLPNNSIGITDLIGYRECARRMAHGMRRHTEGSDPPEAVHPDTMYGKAVHDGITWIEEDLLTNDEAVQRCFDKYGRYLDPEDADRLRADFETYRTRDERGVITVANEREIKVPLLRWTYPGDDAPTQIYFRGRIDRLYQRADDPTVFIHRDYKSSKWRRTEEEVHEDLQLWAYNWSIFEFWPECQRLTQFYDQLRYGDIPTSKSAEQREQMREWLVREVEAVLKDETLDPTYNEWCPWCPILESCSEVRRLSDWAVARITELRANSGEDTPDDLEATPFADYVADLPKIELARKMAERFEESVRGELKKLPETRLDELGYKKSERSSKVWEPEALAALRDLVGEEKFLMLVSVSQTRIKNLLDGDEQKAALGMGRKVGGALTVTKKKT